jgi:hypothetical protein
VFERGTPEKKLVAEAIVAYCGDTFGGRRGHVIDFGSGMAAAPRALMKLGWTLTLTDVDAGKVHRLAAELRPPHRALQVDLLDPGTALAGAAPAMLVCMTHFLYHVPRPRWPECFALARSLLDAEGRGRRAGGVHALAEATRLPEHDLTVFRGV